MTSREVANSPIALNLLDQYGILFYTVGYVYPHNWGIQSRVLNDKQCLAYCTTVSEEVALCTYFKVFLSYFLLTFLQQQGNNNSVLLSLL